MIQIWSKTALALGAIGATSLIFVGCSSGSNESGGPPGQIDPPVGSVVPLSDYTPHGPSGTDIRYFWKKHLPDDAGSFQFEIALDKPVPAQGATLSYELNGTAEAGVHYLSGTPNPIVLQEGATSAVIPIQLLNIGEYFQERVLALELVQATGLELDTGFSRAELWIRPSIDPPTLSIPNLAYSVTAGSMTDVPMFLSHPSQDPVSLHYKVEPTSTLTDYNLAASGTVLFAPGQTSALLPFEALSGAQPGETLTLNLNHERNGVRFVVPALNPTITSNTDLYDQEIHTDENMWTHSVGGVQAFEYDDQRNPAPSGPALPGTPSDNLTGGSTWESGKDDQMLIDLLEQTNPTPIVDPWSGIPLKIYAVADAASGSMPYLRKSFDATFCGSTTQLYTLPEFTRISYYIAMPEGPDAFRAVPFVRIGMRFRSLNLNHGVTLRIGSDGFDSDGNPVPVTQTSLGPIGLWDTLAISPNTDLYGVVEDEYGVRVWYAHKLDPNEPWTQPGTGNTVFEVPGVAFGNPIEYPTWASTGDGSLATMGLSTIDDLTGMGNLAYGFFWEISDDPATYSDNLRPYFPKPANWWEPQGNAVLNSTTSIEFTVR